MYRYIQSPTFLQDIKKYKNAIDDKSLNNFFSDLSNSPRKAKKAHPLHGRLSNIWSAHLKSRGKIFFTILYMLCDEGLFHCSGDQKLCKGFISTCNKPTEQIVFLKLEKGEPYEKLAVFYT